MFNHWGAGLSVWKAVFWHHHPPSAAVSNTACLNTALLAVFGLFGGGKGVVLTAVSSRNNSEGWATSPSWRVALHHSVLTFTGCQHNASKTTPVTFKPRELSINPAAVMCTPLVVFPYSLLPKANSSSYGGFWFFIEVHWGTHSEKSKPSEQINQISRGLQSLIFSPY